MKQALFYGARKTFTPIMRVVYPTKVYGNAENIPEGTIIAANHASFIDPFILTAGLNRGIHFIMKDFLVGDKMLSQTYLGRAAELTSPIWLSGTRMTKEGLKRCIEFLERGELLGIFPEGQRGHTRELQELNPGVAKIARIAEAGVLPVYIDGTYDIWPRHKGGPKLGGQVSLGIGNILEAPNGKGEADFMMRLRGEFERLRDLKYRA